MAKRTSKGGYRRAGRSGGSYRRKSGGVSKAQQIKLVIEHVAQGATSLPAASSVVPFRAKL
jgi:hypothetical protein